MKQQVTVKRDDTYGGLDVLHNPVLHTRSTKHTSLCTYTQAPPSQPACSLAFALTVKSSGIVDSSVEEGKPEEELGSVGDMTRWMKSRLQKLISNA